MNLELLITQNTTIKSEKIIQLNSIDSKNPKGLFERRILTFHRNYHQVKNLLEIEIRDSLGSTCAGDIVVHFLDEIKKFIENPKYQLLNEFYRKDYRFIPIGDINDWYALYEDCLKKVVGIKVSQYSRGGVFKKKLEMRRVYEDHIHHLIANNIARGESVRNTLRDVLNSKRLNFLDQRERQTLLYYLKEKISLAA